MNRTSISWLNPPGGAPGFSKRWLETRIRNGEVPSLRTGPSVRMRRSDVETFVKTGKWPKP